MSDDPFNSLDVMRELAATLVKLAGGRIVLRKEDEIGPYQMRRTIAEDKTTGERVLVIEVQEDAHGHA